MGIFASHCIGGCDSMENGFDFESGKLIVNSGNMHFDLDIRKPISQIVGNSATGKTWLVNYMQNDRKSGVSNGISYFRNVYTVTSVEETKILKGVTKSLILIDRGDFILVDNLVSKIRADRKNTYLIFARGGYSFGISPNYYGEFEMKESGVVVIKYMFSEKGWF